MINLERRFYSVILALFLGFSLASCSLVFDLLTPQETEKLPENEKEFEIIFEDFEAPLSNKIWARSGFISKVINQDPVFASWPQYGDALIDTHGKVYVLSTYNPANNAGGKSSLEMTVNPKEDAVVSFEYKADLWKSNRFTVSVDGKVKLDTSDNGTKWIKVSVKVPAGLHKVTFEVTVPDTMISRSLTNSVYLDNISLVPDVMDKVDIYPKGLQESYVGGNTISFSAKALRSDGSVITDKTPVWTATGGTITKDGLFTPGNKPGIYTVTATIDGKSVSNKSIKIHPQDYKKESYKIGDITYSGYISSTGDKIAPTNYITFDTSEGCTPKFKTVTADGFFVLKGTVKEGKYAVVYTSKEIDSKVHYTTNVLKGDFYERIWLRFGPGEYNIIIYDSDISFRDTEDSRYEGDMAGGWGTMYLSEYKNTNRILSVTNTARTPYETAMWTMPSYFCQSDSFIVSNVVNGLQSEMKENTADGEKIRVMHDWIVQRNYYDFVSVNHSEKRKKQDAVSVINYEMSVCEGYANTLLAMYRNAGFVAKYISSQEMNHGWVQIKYKNEWKLIDATWDESYSDQYNPKDSDSYTDKMQNSEKYTYFLVGLDGIEKDHYEYADDYELFQYTARSIVKN